MDAIGIKKTIVMVLPMPIKAAVPILIPHLNVLYKYADSGNECNSVIHTFILCKQQQDKRSNPPKV